MKAATPIRSCLLDRVPHFLKLTSGEPEEWKLPVAPPKIWKRESWKRGMNLFQEDFLCIETTSIIRGRSGNVGGREGEGGGGGSR